MEGLEIHPLANIIPESSPDDYAALLESIRQSGQLEAIKTWRGKILDGRHRYRACTELGIVPKLTEVSPSWVQGGSDEGLIAYVVGLNASRRHLSAGQRAMIAAKMANAEHGRPRKDTKTCLFTKADACKLFGIGTTSFDQARRLLATGNATLLKLVEDGCLTISAALKAAEQPTGQSLADKTGASEARPKPATVEESNELLKIKARFEKANRKLRDENRRLAESAAQGGDQAAALAAELDRAKAEAAKATAQAEAAQKNLTVAPAKVVYKQDPAKDRAIDSLQKQLAELTKALDEARNKAKFEAARTNDAARALADKTARLIMAEQPEKFLASYQALTLHEFIVRTKSAIGVVRRERIRPSWEAVQMVGEAKALAGELLEVWRDIGAVDSGDDKPRQLAN